MKKGKDNPLEIVFLIAVVVIVFLVGVGVRLIPFVVLVYAIVTAVKCFIEKKAILLRTGRDVSITSAIPDDFWLTESEKDEFIDAYNRLVETIGTKESANKEANEKGLSRNKDGRISLRSNRGKQLRAIIESADERLPGLRSQLNHWQQLPVKRFKRFVNGFRQASALAAGLVAFALAAILNEFFLKGPPEASQYGGASSSTDVLMSPYLAMGLAFAVVWVLLWLWMRGVRRPPLVDADTFDLYSVEDRKSVAAEEPTAAASVKIEERPPTGTFHSQCGPNEAKDRSANYLGPDSSETLSSTDSIPAPWSRLAIWSFVSGLCSILVLPSIPAIVLGHLALKKDKGVKKGVVLARIGLILGWVFLAILVFGLLTQES